MKKNSKNNEVNMYLYFACSMKSHFYIRVEIADLELDFFSEIEISALKIFSLRIIHLIIQFYKKSFIKDN